MPSNEWRNILITAIVAAFCSAVGTAFVFGMDKVATDSRQDEAIKTLQVQYTVIEAKLDRIYIHLVGGKRSE